MDRAFEDQLVSIIIPTYNRSHYISDAVRSAYIQTYRPIELIIVDDGSTDATEDRISTLAKEAGEDIKVQYIRQSNQGAPVARNRGLIESHGEFIQYLDSDDILHPQKLEVQTQILKSYPELDHTWADFHIEEEANFRTFSPSDCDEYSVSDAVGTIDHRRRTPAEVWSGLYRRSICVQAGPWNETLGRWQDVEYNFRIDTHSPKTAYTELKLYKMRSHSTGRIMDSRYESDGLEKGFHTLDIIKRNRERLLAAQAPYLKAPVFNFGGFYFKLLQLALRAGDHDQIERAFREAREHAKSIKRKRGIRLLKDLHWAFGRRLASLAFTLYSMLRGAR
jgi:glycosyltransferase involved in cell wall biosynthesis